MNTTHIAIALLVGAAVGASTSYFICKAKYDKQLKEEIESVVEEFSKSPRVIFKDKKEPAEEEMDILVSNIEFMTKQDLFGAMEISTINNYTETYVDEAAAEYVGKEQMHTHDKPFTISADERDQFMEEGYDVCFWTLYKDENGFGIIADDMDVRVDDEEIENTVGLNIIGKIGEYEPEVAIVCNNRLQLIIELNDDPRVYSDVVKAMPFIDR